MVSLRFLPSQINFSHFLVAIVHFQNTILIRRAQTYLQARKCLTYPEPSTCIKESSFLICPANDIIRLVFDFRQRCRKRSRGALIAGSWSIHLQGFMGTNKVVSLAPVIERALGL